MGPLTYPRPTSPRIRVIQVKKTSVRFSITSHLTNPLLHSNTETLYNLYNFSGTDRNYCVCAALLRGLVCLGLPAIGVLASWRLREEDDALRSFRPIRIDSTVFLYCNNVYNRTVSAFQPYPKHPPIPNHPIPTCTKHRMSSRDTYCNTPHTQKRNACRGPGRIS